MKSNDFILSCGYYAWSDYIFDSFVWQESPFYKLLNAALRSEDRSQVAVACRKWRQTQSLLLIFHMKYLHFK